MTKTKAAPFVLPAAAGPQRLPSGFWSGQIIATGAAVATATSSCVLCSSPITRPQRAAELADGRGQAHVSGCLAAMTAP